MVKRAWTRRYLIPLVFVVLAGAFSGCSPDPVSFNDQIRPILRENCLGCHGGVRESGGLNLITREGALTPTESGALAIVPGKPEESEMLIRINHTDPEMRMPLEHDPLPAEEVKLIKRWIEEGANWETHWAYLPPDTTIRPPDIQDDWIRTDVDRFVLKKQKEMGLEHSPDANAISLLRRVSLDLTGLPPTREQAAYFEKNFSEALYEQMVDSLLASPHFGERWASMWLDLARFADTQGFEKDPHRSIWMYRDYVIDSFNQDKPFDQFTIEQLAGDLLPEPSTETLVATAFHRNTMTNTEGGTDDEEYRIEAVIDRLNTTFEVWQGTTVACVQCHAHPYDPIDHPAYYKAMAYLNNTQDTDQASDQPNLFAIARPDQAKILDLARPLLASHANTRINAGNLTETINRALFPIQVPGYADDWFPRQLHYPGYYPNPPIGKGRGIIAVDSSWIMFRDVPLNGYSGVRFSTYSGIGGKIAVRLERPTGLILGETTHSGSPGADQRVVTDITLPDALDGNHDVFFTFSSNSLTPGNLFILDRIQWLGNGGNDADSLLFAVRDSLINIDRVRVPIMRENPAGLARVTRIFDRGSWISQTDTVEAGVPDILNAGMNSHPADRLEFARWMVDSRNPLTARVIINRFWQRIFGNGIVTTLGDFGAAGDLPVNQELLDYLSVKWMRDYKWHIKPLLREWVMSSTYRQDSFVSEDAKRLDPTNIYLARAPRNRLSAEQLRDQALAVSGLLSRKMFGPSVMPPQPDGVWQVVYSGENWSTPEGEDRYRRAVYTYWRRTSPYPSMVTFDSPSREYCVSMRISTNTPLQALTLLNDPVYLEAAEALATRALSTGIPSTRLQIAWMYEQAMMKPPTSRVLSRLESLFREARKQFAATADSTGLPLEFTPETTALNRTNLARLKVVANTILNLDSFVTNG